MRPALRSTRALLAALVAMLVACGSPPEVATPLEEFDGGSLSDSGLPDSGPLDAGPLDGGPVDAGALDAGRADAGAVDAGRVDAGPLDAGLVDAGALDAGRLDAGATDAGSVDAGRVDAGAADAGPVDGGPPDSGLIACIPSRAMPSGLPMDGGRLFHVALGATDGGDGSATRPFTLDRVAQLLFDERRLPEARCTFRPGDVIRLGPGRFVLPRTLRPPAGVALVGAGPGTTTLTAPADAVGTPGGLFEGGLIWLAGEDAKGAAPVRSRDWRGAELGGFTLDGTPLRRTREVPLSPDGGDAGFTIAFTRLEGLRATQGCSDFAVLGLEAFGFPEGAVSAVGEGPYGTAWSNAPLTTWQAYLDEALHSTNVPASDLLFDGLDLHDNGFFDRRPGQNSATNTLSLSAVARVTLRNSSLRKSDVATTRARLDLEHVPVGGHVWEDVRIENCSFDVGEGLRGVRRRSFAIEAWYTRRLEVVANQTNGSLSIPWSEGLRLAGNRIVVAVSGTDAGARDHLEVDGSDLQMAGNLIQGMDPGLDLYVPAGPVGSAHDTHRDLRIHDNLFVGTGNGIWLRTFVGTGRYADGGAAFPDGGPGLFAFRLEGLRIEHNLFDRPWQSGSGDGALFAVRFTPNDSSSAALPARGATQLSGISLRNNVLLDARRTPFGGTTGSAVPVVQFKPPEADAGWPGVPYAGLVISGNLLDGSAPGAGTGATFPASVSAPHVSGAIEADGNMQSSVAAQPWLDRIPSESPGSTNAWRIPEAANYRRDPNVPPFTGVPLPGDGGAVPGVLDEAAPEVGPRIPVAWEEQLAAADALFGDGVERMTTQGRALHLEAGERTTFVFAIPGGATAALPRTGRALSLQLRTAPGSATPRLSVGSSRSVGAPSAPLCLTPGRLVRVEVEATGPTDLLGVQLVR